MRIVKLPRRVSCAPISRDKGRSCSPLTVNTWWKNHFLLPCRWTGEIGAYFIVRQARSRSRSLDEMCWLNERIFFVFLPWSFSSQPCHITEQPGTVVRGTDGDAADWSLSADLFQGVFPHHASLRRRREMEETVKTEKCKVQFRIICRAPIVALMWGRLYEALSETGNYLWLKEKINVVFLHEATLASFSGSFAGKPFAEMGIELESQDDSMMLCKKNACA